MKKVLLLILDGFGYSTQKKHNAILQADAPFIHSLFNEYNYSLLNASAKAVGLPDGIMGNSEVGHITIGAGRIIYQDLTRINKFIKEEGFQSLPLIKQTTEKEKVHLMGLVSDGGVHSHIDHLLSLIDYYQQNHPNKAVCVHIITDGRDTPPKSAKKYIQMLQDKCSGSQVQIASICGRFYAMDRDKRWDRIQKAYNNLISNHVDNSDPMLAIEQAYKNKQTDEFIEPIKCSPDTIATNDAVVFFNFRSDRAREICQAFTSNDFSHFERAIKLKPEQWICFTQYSEDFTNPVLFPKQSPKNILGEIMQQNQLKQLRIAETEKYAHVTYFMNGGREDVFEGEDRILVDSPKEVKTYDEKPEMSAFEVTEKLVQNINRSFYDLIICNYANGDMVGHTGNMPAAIKSVEALDKCLKEVINAAIDQKYEVFLTADHGNCEEMMDPKGQEVSTQHSMNPVPFIHISKDSKELNNGGLQDIAPTILSVMDINRPKEMTGKVLFK